jgi:site-specific DNA recombinase
VTDALHAGLYARVSTEDQAERYGLGAQLRELRAHAAARGYIIDGTEFIDDGVSGATLDRPALRRLRTAIRDGAIQVVCIVDPDRFSRKLAHLLLLTEECERAQIRLEYLTTPRSDTPESRLLEHVKGVIAEYEREKIRERTVHGRLEKARRGLRVAARAPYGYRLDPTHPGGLLIDEPTAAVVRRLFRECVDTGRSVRGLTRLLQAESIPAPKGGRWATSEVARILRSSTYAGQWAYGRVRREGTQTRRRDPADWIMVPVPALVEPTQWAAAQAQLARNRQRHSGRPAAQPSLLRGLLRCGVCGRPMHGWTAHRGPRRYRYYRCAGDDRLRVTTVTRCTALVPAATVDTAVWTAVSRLLQRPDLLAGRLAASRVRLGVREVEVRSEVEHLRRQRIELGRQTQRVLAFLDDETLPTEELRMRLRVLEARRTDLTARLTAAEARAQAYRVDADRAVAVRVFCATLGARVRELGATPEGRRMTLERCLEVVVAHPGGRIEIQTAIPLTPAPAEPLATPPVVRHTVVLPAGARHRDTPTAAVP